MKNLGRINYKSEFNRTFVQGGNGQYFLEKRGTEAISKYIRRILDKVTMVEENGDVQLTTFLATESALEGLLPLRDVMSVIVFPTYGEVKKYGLKRNGPFYSDLHKQTDPLLVTGLRSPIVLSSEELNWNIGLANHETAPNHLSGGVFLKYDPTKEPERYKWFKHLMAWKRERELR